MPIVTLVISDVTVHVSSYVTTYVSRLVSHLVSHLLSVYQLINKCYSDGCNSRINATKKVTINGYNSLKKI